MSKKCSTCKIKFEEYSGSVIYSCVKTLTEKCDFYMCNFCFVTRNEHHKHALCRLTQDDEEGVVDYPASCSGCGEYILGFLHNCGDCINFDLCRTCFERGIRCDDKQHLLTYYKNSDMVSFAYKAKIKDGICANRVHQLNGKTVPENPKESSSSKEKAMSLFKPALLLLARK